jgi:hypothetical protein
MNFTIQVQGLQQVQQRIASLPKQLRYAGGQALKDAGFKAREEWREKMRAAFDRPTPYVIDSIYVNARALPERLSVWIYPSYNGGKGVDPEKVLLAQVHGGARRAKRFEVALRNKGVLPNNMAAVPARWVLADPAIGDGYGGVKGSFIVRLLSVLQAFGEQGYRANMTARNIAKLSGKGRWVNGRFYGAQTKKGSGRQGAMALRQGGVEYFVSRGKGEFTGRGSWKNGQQQHLPAGIWQRSGLYGAEVKPVFLFTRMPRYVARLNLPEIAQRAMGEHFPAAFSARLQRALATAR